MPGPMGGPGGGAPTPKAKNFKVTTKKLINSYLSKYKFALIIYILEKILICAFYLLIKKTLC